MLLVNNTNKLKKVMVFNPKKSYYKFVALIRAKDYKNSEDKPVLMNTEKQEVFVKQWLVDSEELLDKCLPDMLAVTEMFKCRLYMTTDRKSTVKTMMYARNKLNECLDHFVMSENASVSVRMLNKLIPSASLVSESSDSEKRWMFDVDTKNKYVLKFVQEKVCGEHYLETFETKNGYHVLANKKFNANGKYAEDFDYYFDALREEYPNVSFNTLSKYNECVEVKSNALVLVAMGS